MTEGARMTPGRRTVLGRRARPLGRRGTGRTARAQAGRAAPRQRPRTVAARPARSHVIGHRGASGYRPEHTLGSYQLALDMGAARHRAGPGAHQGRPPGVPPRERHLGHHGRRRPPRVRRPARPPRASTASAVTGWFTEDFTLAELKTLRAKERIPGNRQHNTLYDGRWEVPTFEEVLRWARGAGPPPRPPGLAVHRDQAPHLLPRARPRAWRTAGRDAAAPVRAPPRGLPACSSSPSSPAACGGWRSWSTRPRVVLLSDAGTTPWDFVASGDPRTVADLVKPGGPEVDRLLRPGHRPHARPDHPDGRGGQADHAHHAGTRRARDGPDPAPVHDAQREHLPARRLPARHRPQRLRRRLRRLQGLLRDRYRRPLLRQRRTPRCSPRTTSATATLIGCRPGWAATYECESAADAVRRTRKPRFPRGGASRPRHGSGVTRAQPAGARRGRGRGPGGRSGGRRPRTGRLGKAAGAARPGTAAPGALGPRRRTGRGAPRPPAAAPERPYASDPAAGPESGPSGRASPPSGGASSARRSADPGAAPALLAALLSPRTPPTGRSQGSWVCHRAVWGRCVPDAWDACAECWRRRLRLLNAGERSGRQIGGPVSGRHAHMGMSVTISAATRRTPSRSSSSSTSATRARPSSTATTPSSRSPRPSTTWGRTGGGHGLVARLGDEVVASVRGSVDASGTARIDKLIVHPRMRRHGLGGRLLDAIEAHSRRSRPPSASSSSPATAARRNLRLYRSHGYAAVGTEQLSARLTLVTLEKPAAAGVRGERLRAAPGGGRRAAMHAAGRGAVARLGGQQRPGAALRSHSMPVTGRMTGMKR